jgi:glycosyltransferase involved in cell wall biosynthesis
LVLFEAADFRKPVIAANQGVMADVVPRLVPGVLAQLQPNAFASAILSLEANPVSDQDFTEAARNRESASKDIVADWNRLISTAANGV